MKKLLGIISALLVATVAMSQFQYWMFQDEFAAASRPTATSSAWTVPQPDYLIAEYQFENNWNDSVGTNTGSASNGATFVSLTNKFGSYAAYFDGGNDYVICGQEYACTQKFSVAFWAYQNSAKMNKLLLLPVGLAKRYGFIRLGGTFNGATTGGRPHGMALTRADEKVSSTEANTWPTNAQDTWRHVVVTYDCTSTPSTVIYKDAVSQTMYNDLAKAASGIGASITLYFGIDCDTDWPYGGLIDQFRLWSNVVLTASEVTNLFQETE